MNLESFGHLEVNTAGWASVSAMLLGIAGYWLRRFMPSPARDRDKLHGELKEELQEIRLENRALEKELDHERAMRRAAEDNFAGLKRRNQTLEDENDWLRRQHVKLQCDDDTPTNFQIILEPELEQ